ncbi:hypothetical protein [Marinobacter changyiensis]|uniref:hypothetical protein n=1 Tax=Marinobacter changyiensis TaxID=2604091 RepID=UPI0012657A14|nr:hypothetical protein [Marinobacter changyiensis]
MTFPIRVAIAVLLLVVTQVATAEVITARTVSSTEVFEDQGRSVVVSTEVPSELIGLYWLKPKPSEFFKDLERRLTLRADGTVTTQAAGGPRVLRWGVRVEGGALQVSRYPGPVWMGSHEGEDLAAYTLVLRYQDGSLEEKKLFESRDRLAIEGPAGMALIKQY